MLTTTFENKALILGQLWINYKAEDEGIDFFIYNDLGLPLAYLIHTDLVAVTETGMPYVDETFNLLCTALGLDSDEEYASLNELMELQDDEDEEE
jgi:hypothetical protein